MVASFALAHSQNNQHFYTSFGKRTNAALVTEPTRTASVRTASIVGAKTTGEKSLPLFRAGEITNSSSSVSQPNERMGSNGSGALANDGKQSGDVATTQGDAATAQGNASAQGDAATTQGDASTQDESATTQEQNTPKTLSASIASADGNTYTVTLTYDQTANIPNGAQLNVVELNQLPNDWGDEEKQRTTYKDRPLATELLLEEDEYNQRKDMLAKALELGKDDKIVWNKYLDITIVADDEEITPAADVTLEIQTNAVPAASSDALEAVQLNGDESKRLEATNTTGTKADEKNKKPEELNARLSTNTNKLGELAVAQVVQKKFGWQLFDKAINVYAARSVEATPHEIPLNIDYLNDSRLVSLVGILVNPTRAYGTNLWVDAATLEGASDETGNVVVYSLHGNNESSQLVGKEGT